MQYVPLWTDILDAPNWKILDLPAELYRFWTFCLMAAQKHDHINGFLPDHRTLCRWFGMNPAEAKGLMQGLVDAGLIDAEFIESNLVHRIHDWQDWRTSKDKTATERKRRQREKEKQKRDAECNGHADVTGQSRSCHASGHGDVTPQQTTTQHSAFSIQHSADNNPPTPRDGDHVVVSSSEETEPPEFPDPVTTIVTVQSGDHTISETKARQIWGHLWRQWKNAKLCFGFYEYQRWCSAEAWLYAIEAAVKQDAQPGHIKYLKKIGMDFDINGPKREKPLRKGDIGPVPYKATYIADDGAPVKTFPIYREQAL